VGSSTQINVDPRNTAFVARQPILEQSGRLFGYELLYRDASQEEEEPVGDDLAAARVLSDTVLALGLDTLTGGLPAFVNLTRSLLMSEAGTLLPKASTVLELRNDLAVDEEMLEVCAGLHRQGYSLALDGFDPRSDAARLLPYAKFVKMDVLSTSAEVMAALSGQLGPKGIRLVAEKVETTAAMQEARAWGCGLFQGYFFCSPTTFSAEAVPGRRPAYAGLLAAINEPNLTVNELEDLIKHDVSLCLRVLKCINSAAFGLRHEVRSIRQALLLLGINQIRKWASVWAVAGLNTGGASEMVTMALVRARCCELVGVKTANAELGSQYFLLGLCSLFDAMLGRPMAEAIQELPLSSMLRAALLGEPNEARSVLDVIIAYERGEWDSAIAGAELLGIGGDLIPASYADALKWSRELSRSALAS
jgi:EAL and modified HD-GYP domain-containing signal transduction protein